MKSRCSRNRPFAELELSRRRAMHLVGGIAAGALAGGPAWAALARQGDNDDIITIPDPGPGFPEEDVSFQWMDNGGAKKMFFDAFFPAYERKHPNVSTDYTALPSNQMSEAIQTGIQSGNAPDVFQLPTGVPAAQAVREGWIAPLDDLIPGFADWKAALPPRALQEGSNVFEGKVYSLPVNGTSKEYFALTYYNTEIMERAGYNPREEPLTWDTFRSAAQEITAQGNGQYYGFILGGRSNNWWERFVGNLAIMAGASAGPDFIDYRTGEYVFTSDEFLAATELLLAMRDDGVVFPGSMSVSFQEAAAQMPLGVAGMFQDGPWNIAIWRDTSPDFGFDVTGAPLPPSGSPAPITYGPNGGTFWVNAASPEPDKLVAGDIMRYLGTEAGMLAFQTLSGAPRSSIYATVDQSAMIDERSQRIFAHYDEQMRLGPYPATRNPDVSLVALEGQALQPSFGQVVQGLYAGQLDDIGAAMQDLQDRSNAELDRAIAAARAKGAEVSRDDWVFPNWDPAQDYVDEDYEAL